MGPEKRRLGRGERLCGQGKRRRVEWSRRERRGGMEMRLGKLMSWAGEGVGRWGRGVLNGGGTKGRGESGII